LQFPSNEFYFGCVNIEIHCKELVRNPPLSLIPSIQSEYSTHSGRDYVLCILYYMSMKVWILKYVLMSLKYDENEI
jgi:hypothetical protein